MTRNRLIASVALAGLFYLGCIAAAVAQQPPTLDVTLTWNPPTQNTDGTPLTDLAGYKVYWGTVSGTYPNSVSAPIGSSYVVADQNLLEDQNYCFVVTAVNSFGTESVPSNESCVTTPTLPRDPNPPGGLTVTVTINFGV